MMDTAIPRTRLPVDMVEIGMRIIKLDRPWTEVPLLFQGFVVDTPDQIQTLRHYCHWVLVEGDPKRLAIIDERLEALNRKVNQPLPELRSLKQELPKAKAAYGQTQDFVDRILSDIEADRELDFSDAKPLIHNCVQSIQSNANAMFWMARIKSQDAYTAEHCLRVAIYAIAFGRFLGMPQEDLQVIGLCGLLHDIGKLKVPAGILNKPGPLTADEMAEMQRHTEFGYQLLQSHHQLEPIVADVTRHHHERIDGKGYPHRLDEWQISRFARIVAIVDAFDAMTSDRCYREGIPSSEAMRELYRGRGEQFDANMIEAFIRMVGIYPAGTLVELSTGEVALVIAAHPGKKLRPRVEIILGADKRGTVPYIIDLAENPLDSEGRAYSIKQPLADGAHGVSLGARIGQVMAVSGHGAAGA